VAFTLARFVSTVEQVILRLALAALL
jgi:hypothetical protein